MRTIVIVGLAVVALLVLGCRTVPFTLLPTTGSYEDGKNEIDIKLGSSGTLETSWEKVTFEEDGRTTRSLERFCHKRLPASDGAGTIIGKIGDIVGAAFLWLGGAGETIGNALKGM